MSEQATSVTANGRFFQPVIIGEFLRSAWPHEDGRQFISWHRIINITRFHVENGDVLFFTADYEEAPAYRAAHQADGDLAHRALYNLLKTLSESNESEK